MAVSFSTPGSADSTDPSYSVPAGSNRLLIVGITYEDNPNRDITACDFGDASMTAASGDVFGGFSFVAGLRLWVLNEAGISGATGTTISPTFSGTPDEYQVHYVTAFDVDQTTSTTTAVTDSATDGTTLEANIAGVVDGAIVAIGASGASGAANWTNVTEQTDLASSSSRGSMAFDTTSSTSTVEIDLSFTSQNRGALAAIGINPAAGSPDTDADATVASATGSGHDATVSIDVDGGSASAAGSGP